MKPCRNGHLSDRFPHNGKCIECQRAKNRRSYHRESQEVRRRKYQRKYLRIEGDPVKRLHSRIGNYLRKGFKKNWMSLEPLLGYSISTLKIHLERQFSGEMSWQNYGTHWHIDHIIPLKLFDNSEIRQAWALSNLRPLPAKDNLHKGCHRTHLI
jgi:5-methylcytosine-specific restriction endonuclease McrA